MLQRQSSQECGARGESARPITCLPYGEKFFTEKVPQPAKQSCTAGLTAFLIFEHHEMRLIIDLVQGSCRQRLTLQLSGSPERSGFTLIQRRCSLRCNSCCQGLDESPKSRFSENATCVWAAFAHLVRTLCMRTAAEIGTQGSVQKVQTPKIPGRRAISTPRNSPFPYMPMWNKSRGSALKSSFEFSSSSSRCRGTTRRARQPSM